MWELNFKLLLWIRDTLKIDTPICISFDTGTEGDATDKIASQLNRMEEMLESLNIIEQLIDNIPAGEFQAKRKPIIKLPEGSFYQAVESSRGELGVFIESKGDKTPYRVHYRSSSPIWPRPLVLKPAIDITLDIFIVKSSWRAWLLLKSRTMINMPAR